MELVLDFRPSQERPGAGLEQDRFEQFLACLQLFVGHELPNILVPCQAYARLLAEQAGGLDEEGRDMLRRVADLVQKADRWGRQLAEIGRLLRGSPWGPAVSVAEVACEAVAEVKARREATVASLIVVEPMPELEVNRDLLHAVLVQLLRNSARAVLTKAPGQVEVTTTETCDGCLIQVKDQGTGMAEGQARLLLGPFEAARQPGAAGIGLGFFLVRQAAARWAGRLRVSSQPGQGTTVDLLIPRPARGARQ
jgi:signal transduction histidine kinase